MGQTLRKNKGRRFCLVFKSSHFNIQKQAYCKKMSDEGGAAITQEREGNAGDGKQPNGHANIKNNVKRDGTDES
jgi:hypothetical protein